MQRRKFITGLGALVTGSAAAMGTGAFSSVEASRSVTVNTANDASAYLGLTAGDTDYVSNDSGSGQLTIDLGGPTTGGQGKGFNENATTFVHNIVVVKNQGNNDVGVGFTNGNGSETVTVPEGEAKFSFDPNGNRNLSPGESVHIDVKVDTTASGGTAGSLTIEADEDWYSS